MLSGPLHLHLSFFHSKKNLTMMQQERKAIVNLPVQKTRKLKIQPQAKSVQNTIMECILEEVEAEKNFAA
jgi:hypothetical protein